MPVDNAGPSFVAWCRGCPWRSVHHLRRDAQQALGRHGETCGMGFGGSTEGGKGPETPRNGPLAAEQPESVSQSDHDSGDEREAGR